MDDRRSIPQIGVSPGVEENWGYPGIFDLDSNGTLEKRDRQHKAVAPSEIQ